jgi:competence protein ComFB
MARKSSKTAHVMNLLAGDEPETSKSEAAKENQAASLNTDSSETIKELTVLAHKASIQTQEGPLTPSPISIIDMSSSSPDPVSEMIRQQLEEEEGITTDSSQDTAIEENVTEAGNTESEKAVTEGFESTGIGSEELKTETPIDDRKKNAVAGDSNESDANSTGSTEALGNSESGSDVKGNIGDEEKDTPMILTASEVKVIEADFEEPKRNPSLEPEAMKSKDSASIPEPDKPTFKYLNVMEHVVQNKVHEYAAKFDTCCCGHCIADITALTLTNLPPKYVVVKPPTASPLLNFYMNRYSQQVIVEITKACFTVKQNPHH